MYICICIYVHIYMYMYMYVYIYIIIILTRSFSIQVHICSFSPRQPLPSITSPLAPPPNQCHGPSLRPNPETRHRNMSPQIAPTQPATSEPNRWPDPLITSWTQQEPLGTSWNQAGTMVEPAGTKIYVNLYVYTSQVSK